MTQRNVRGAYYVPTHDYNEDWAWLAAWQPNVIRLMLEGKPDDPNTFDVHQVKRVHDTCPDATLLLRCWDVDDRNFAAHDEMVKDPHGEAERQVNWWGKVFDNAVAAGVPRQLLMAGLNNETGPDKDGALYPYTEHALSLATPRQMRLGVLVFSVGRPSLPGEAQYTIDTFTPLDAAISANRGAIMLHQYMQKEGMYGVWTDNEGKERHDWTYLMGRDKRWSVKSDIIIGEWGLNGLLYNRDPDPKYGDSGWTNFPKLWPPSRYADEYVESVKQANPNVIGICPYLEDWKDHKWQSFDLRSAYSEFLARKDLCVKDAADTPPVITHLPSIGNNPFGPSKPAYVSAPSGANLRKAPRTDGDLITAIPFGEQVEAYGDDTSTKWKLVEYQGKSGFIRDDLLSDSNPAFAPPPSVTNSECWTRAILFVLTEEGGYQNTPADSGNWTGCKEGVGENKGTNFGISACSYPNEDIVNLTKEEAIAIYQRDYWGPSGASELPWPACLFVFDSAILHGVGTAKAWLNEVGQNPYAFAAKRLAVYTKLNNGDVFWRGWVNRVAALLEVVKE